MSAELLDADETIIALKLTAYPVISCLMLNFSALFIIIILLIHCRFLMSSDKLLFSDLKIQCDTSSTFIFFILFSICTGSPIYPDLNTSFSSRLLSSFVSAIAAHTLISVRPGWKIAKFLLAKYSFSTRLISHMRWAFRQSFIALLCALSLSHSVFSYRPHIDTALRSLRSGLRRF